MFFVSKIDISGIEGGDVSNVGIIVYYDDKGVLVSEEEYWNFVDKDGNFMYKFEMLFLIDFVVYLKI